MLFTNIMIVHYLYLPNFEEKVLKYLQKSPVPLEIVLDQFLALINNIKDTLAFPFCQLVQ